MTTLATQPSAATTPSTRTLWDIDTSHAHAGFKVRHMMVMNVRGELGPVTGTVILDEQNPTKSTVEVKIDVRGINTREPKRDEHLRSADFFDVENHPYVTFASKQIAARPDGSLELTGDLTIRGTTRSITLEVEALGPALADPWGNVKRGATARGKLNRKDYGLEWNVALEAGGFLVGEEVAVEIEVELALRK